VRDQDRALRALSIVAKSVILIKIQRAGKHARPLILSTLRVVKPNRITAERLHERPMCVAIIRVHPRRQRSGPRPDDCVNVRRRQRERLKLQRRLACRGQLDIDRGSSGFAPVDGSLVGAIRFLLRSPRPS